MTNVTASGASTPATVEQLAVPRAMIAATEPYRAAAQLVSTFDEVVEVLSDSDLLRVDDKKQLLCLQNTRTEAGRWRLGYRARDELSDLPACADVQAALHAIRRDLDTEPPIEHRVELVGMMLDVQGITADLSYIQYLAWKLGDCPQRKTETRKRSKPWFSLVTISRTIDEVLTTLRPEYGRPVPVAEVLDIAGRNASDLIGVHHSIINLNNTIVRLHRIVDATRDAKPPDKSEPRRGAITIDDDMDISF
jgi:hypothetical protein